eukprot:TRINITY_DN8454_c0_g1_i2.p2 TRINITY_DN8454_c0_g1~~TRINITY_DN8454_c0_g1_i2.p2  ORF type:complete len:109 (+),score=23.43 TRINITY_DN8454_c0_g1_i2:511-837(+)
MSQWHSAMAAAAPKVAASTHSEGAVAPPQLSAYAKQLIGEYPKPGLQPRNFFPAAFKISCVLPVDALLELGGDLLESLSPAPTSMPDACAEVVPACLPEEGGSKSSCE